MWVTGSLVLILTAALVGMTTSPSDYTVAIVDCACAPLEKTSNAILTVLNAALDFTVSPVFILSQFGTTFLDLCKELCTKMACSLLDFVEYCLRNIVVALQTVISYATNLTLKAAKKLGAVKTTVTPIVSFSGIAQKYCSSIKMLFDHILYDLFIQTYIKTCLIYIFEACHILTSFPLLLIRYTMDKVIVVLKYLIALPSRCLLSLIKYVLYSFLHPYVCVIYSSCTVGIFVLVIPVLMHVCRVRDIRPLVRWLCTVAMNSESRNRVLDILYRMTNEEISRRDVGYMIGQSEDAIEGVVPEPETREECAVCYQTERLLKIVPCGHKTTCFKCLQEIGKINNRCPMCREHILFTV
ncbi:uncharacterized protein LOC128555640 [Mercenaria mercenaria]|uniref:uncharacterized protein LOC128555640 n=1 Tax=Mercenaria mercenaria TaxID=6596 RepID=UPI00234EA59C|nr:uncharacterized protein LOC128555640 [Mercenaria mercenaria]